MPTITASKDWWCCAASHDIERAIIIHRISGYEICEIPHPLVDRQRLSQELAMALEKDGSPPLEQLPQVLDLTKPSDWMEYIELLEHRRDQEGGAGAYDTLRCDLPILFPSGEKASAWRIWGQEFHLHRLRNSYRSLLHVKNKTVGTVVPKNNENELLANERIQQATDESEKMLQALLEEAKQAPMSQAGLDASVSKEDVSQAGLDASVSKEYVSQAGLGASVSKEDVWIQSVRLTLLWSSSSSHGGDDHSCAIVVRGHACCSTRLVKEYSFVEPVVCTIAAQANSDNATVTVDEALPSRLGNSQNKVAAWTRVRKTMERPERYKPTGVSEVLMVRRHNNTDNGNLELLEGISSNFFVVYRDGTLRTATDGVLFGYVRQLVLECAPSCGLTIDPRPILLHEALEWKEAFITSSSRLLFPISKILMQQNDDSADGALVFCDFWRDPVLTGADGTETFKTDNNDGCNMPKWQEILIEIVRRGGCSRE